MMQEISLLRGVSTLGGLRGLSIESLPLGLDDASNQNWTNPVSLPYSSSKNNPPNNMSSTFHTSPTVSHRNTAFRRDQSVLSLGLDSPIPDE